MTAAILSLPSSTWSIEKKARAVRAFHKIGWMHNDLLARHHVSHTKCDSLTRRERLTHFDMDDQTQEAFVGDQPPVTPLCTPAAPDRRDSHTNPFSPGLACPMSDESCGSDPSTPGNHDPPAGSSRRPMCNGSGSDDVSSGGSSNKETSDSSLPSLAGLRLGGGQDIGCPFDQLNPAPQMGNTLHYNSKGNSPLYCNPCSLLQKLTCRIRLCCWIAVAYI